MGNLPEKLRAVLSEEDRDCELNPEFQSPYNVWALDDKAPLLPWEWFWSLDDALNYIDGFPERPFVLEVLITGPYGECDYSDRLTVMPPQVASILRLPRSTP